MMDMASISRQKKSSTFTGRQKWWLPSFKTCVNLQEPFILVVFNLKMEQEFWYSGQKRPGVVHKVAHTALLPKHLFSPTSFFRNSPSRQLRYKTWFCPQDVGGFQPQNRPGQKRPGVAHKMAHTALLPKKTAASRHFFL